MGEFGLMVRDASLGLAGASAVFVVFLYIWEDGIEVGIETLGDGFAEEFAKGEEVEALVGVGEGCAFAEAVGVFGEEVDEATGPSGDGGEEDVDIAFGEVGKDGAQGPEPFGVDGFEEGSVDEL